MDNVINGFHPQPSREFTRDDTVDIPGFDDLPTAKLPAYKKTKPADFFGADAQKMAHVLRAAPHNIEAEQAVLGGLMLSPEKLDTVKSSIFGLTDFYQRDHQLIYQALCDLAARKQPIDAVTVSDWFASNPELSQSVDGAYVIELIMNTPSAANLQAYVDIVRDKALQRQLIQACRAIIDSVYERDGKAGIELLTDANSRISQLCKNSMRGGEIKLMESGLKAMFRDIEKRQKGMITGIVPQWESVKKIIPKLEAGELMILGARPGMGKSANAMQWALHAAQNNQACAVFSMEMSMNMVLMRAMSTLSSIPLHDMRRENGLHDEDWTKIVDTIRIMKDVPLGIDDSGPLTVEQIRARAVHFHSQCEAGLKLIIVDYLQLMKGSDTKGINRNEQLAHITRELRSLAKELDCPVIVLSQLNRDSAGRANKAPEISDLRDSGAIESDADIIAFLYRPAYYAKETVSVSNDEAGRAHDNANNVCDFHVAKNRNGATGHAMLRAQLQYCRFQDGTGLSLAVAEQNLLMNQRCMNNGAWKKAA